MSRWEPDEPTPDYRDDPDELGDRDWHDKQDEIEAAKAKPYQIDGSQDRFATYSEAVLAAASKVAQLHVSIAIYKNNELIDLRRF